MTSMKIVTAKWAIERIPFDELPLLMEWMEEKGFYRKGDDSLCQHHEEFVEEVSDGQPTVAELLAEEESESK